MDIFIAGDSLVSLVFALNAKPNITIYILDNVPKTFLTINFEILSDFNSMYEGLIIKYRVSPFPFTRVGWTTKITYVEKPFGFIDKQISGPFSFWEHEHKFEEKNKSLWAYDVVKFKLPLGFIGRFFGGKIVKYQLKNIFEFRRKQLDKFFKKWEIY